MRTSLHVPSFRWEDNIIILLKFLPRKRKWHSSILLKTGSSTSYRGCLSVDYITQNIQYISRKTGCPNDNNFVECLRNIPALELLDKTWPPSNVLKIPYIPAADGETIRQMPAKLLSDGKVLMKDILIGEQIILISYWITLCIFPFLSNSIQIHKK